MPQQENTSSTYVDDLRDAERRGDGLEYAAAVGLIAAIARPSRYGRYGTLSTGMTDTERLAEIRSVLNALDTVTASDAGLPRNPHGGLDLARLDGSLVLADIEDGAPRGTDEAEEHAPKPAGVDGFTHKRGQPFGETS